MDAARDLKARKKIEETLWENEAKAKAEKAVAAGKPISFKAEHDGIIFGNKIQPIFDTKGKVVQLAVYCKNITVLKKTIQALEEKELALKTKSLEEINTTMKVLLKKREEDKTEIENNMMTNVHELIAPYFEKIKKPNWMIIKELF